MNQVANKKVQARRSRQPDPYGVDALAAYQAESDAALPTVDNTQTTRFAISQSRAVFSPCNPMQAKQDIALEGACSLPSPLLHWKPLSSLCAGAGNLSLQVSLQSAVAIVWIYGRHEAPRGWDRAAALFRRRLGPPVSSHARSR